MHQRDGDHLIPGPGHIVAHHSAALRTLVLDQDLDLDQGPTLIHPAGLAPDHVPMAGLILVPLILDAMDAVMGAHGQGPVPGQGLMDTGALALHGLLRPSEQQAGKE